MITGEVSNKPASQSKFDVPFVIFEVCYFLALALAPTLFGSVDIWAFSLVIFLVTTSSFFYWTSFIRTGGGIYKIPLNKPIFFYVVFFLVSVYFSKIPYFSFIELYKLAGMLCVFHATLLYCHDRKHTYRLAQFLLFLATALAIVGILQFLGGLPKDWWHKPNFLSSTYVNHNHYAGFLVVTLPIALGLVFAEREASKKVLFIFLLAVAGVSFIFAVSRGGLAGLGSAILFLVLLLRSHREIRATSPFIIIALLIVAAVIMFGSNPVERRFTEIQQMTQEEEMSLHFRLLTWEGAFNMLRPFLLFGSGPGTFGHVFLMFRPEGSSLRPVYTHNDFLNLLNDCGIFVFLAAAWIVYVLFRQGLKVVFKDDSRMRMGVGSGALAAIFGLMVHGLFDFNFHIPANWLFCTVAVGILFSMDNDVFYPAKGVLSAALKLSVGSILVMVIAASLYLGLSDYYYWESKALLKQGLPKDAIASVQKSLAMNPFSPESHYLSGFIRKSMIKTEKKHADAKQIDKITADLDQAIQLNRYEPMYDFMKARVNARSLASRSTTELVRLYEQALKKDPKNPVLYVMVARDILEVDPKDTSDIRFVAKQWLKRAIEMDSGLAEISYELLWRHEKNVSSILSFYQSIPSGLKGLVFFLEKNDLWKYHRKYFLKMHGLDEEIQKRKMLDASWDEKSSQIMTLKDFLMEEGEAVYYDEFFYESGEVSKNINFHKSLCRLVLQAKGSAVRGIYPTLHIKVDDNVVQDSLYLDSKEFKNYYALIYVTPGFHRLTLEFANDTQDKRSGQDRNIWVRRIEVQESLNV